MLTISSFTVENMEAGCVTDNPHPAFSWKAKSDKNDVQIERADIFVNGWEGSALKSPVTRYQGKKLEPLSRYVASLIIETKDGEVAEKELSFETGLMGGGFNGKFITDGEYKFTEKKVSPKVMVFRKKLEPKGQIKRARFLATAIGLYRIDINGKKVSDDFFTPGFTSYKNNLQYQIYDVTDMLGDSSEIVVTVAGGWAVGSFVFSRVNRVTADRQSFLGDIIIDYEDGKREIIGTDKSWEVAMDGPVKMADLYDGEEYDATIENSALSYKKAEIENVKIYPEVSAAYGEPVREHETFEPISTNKIGDEIIYDFGQNFAGIVHLEIQGRKGQKITVRHAEVLHPDGRLNTDFLRSAKASIGYTCKDGYQEYAPSFTYMGFRYASVSGISEDKIKVTARALYSDVKENGSFTCSNEMINRLQENISWGAKSNFVEIPTDCPQRDERMGWTGDIALFSRTACYNFNMSRFLNKWLRDVRSEQKATGGIPNTVPSQGFGFPVTMPVMAIDFWGDAAVMVPYAEYMARGDISVLRDNYKMMKKYVNACRFWAGLFSFGKKSYIWDTLYTLHFGDWVAPDVPTMQEWQKRSKWTATASLCNTSALLSEIADILGEKNDAAYYRGLSKKVADAYVSVFTDGNGRLLEEFQTAYVLPIYFNMFDEKQKKRAAENLAKLVRKNDYKIGTGFPGTPYILFALADNGFTNDAFKMLLNTECPSWLYEVKMGATTIWERWDGLDENGNCPIGDDGTDTMISYNHYASGAVGDFFYRRIAGIEATEGGYKSFVIKPVIGGGITSACGRVDTAYGEIISSWRFEGSSFNIDVRVPIGSRCRLVMPDGKKYELSNGEYSFACSVSSNI